MGTYIAILRGVNVGGHNRIKMPALVKLFEDLGHTDVVTYIQSGNVVFKSASRSAKALARAIEERIARDLGCDVAVLLRTKNELADVVQSNPFLREQAEPKQLHVTFMAEAPSAALVRAAEAFDAGTDQLLVRGREAFLYCPGGYGNSKLNGTFVEKRLQTVSTTRNWNTVNKLLELAP